jgi:hypothetical protein
MKVQQCQHRTADRTTDVRTSGEECWSSAGYLSTLGDVAEKEDISKEEHLFC